LLDACGEADPVLVELVAAAKDEPVLARQLLAEWPLAIFREPPPVQRLESRARGAVRAVARADDVIHEVALVIDQHLLRRHSGSGVARHDVVVVEADDLAGAAEAVRRL